MDCRPFGHRYPMDTVSELVDGSPRVRRRTAVSIAYGATGAASVVFAWLTGNTPDVFVHEFWAAWFIVTAILCFHTARNPYSGRSIAVGTAAAVVAFWSRSAAILLGYYQEQLVGLQPARAGLGIAMWALLGVFMWIIGYGASVNGAFISPVSYHLRRGA